MLLNSPGRQRQDIIYHVQLPTQNSVLPYLCPWPDIPVLRQSDLPPAGWQSQFRNRVGQPGVISWPTFSAVPVPRPPWQKSWGASGSSATPASLPSIPPAFLDLILRVYRANRTDGFRTFQGKKAGRLVSVGPVNLPVTRLYVEEIILECRQKHITRVDILGFEFEMGLFPNVLDEARTKGIDIAPKYIPAEVFDKRAVEKNQVVFHDVAAIEVTPHVVGAGLGLPRGTASRPPTEDRNMTYDPRLHDRRSIRLRGHDYAAGGAYFVTICTQAKKSLFGEIVEGNMLLNEAGSLVQKIWDPLPQRFRSLVVDAFQIMPNYLHGILVLPGPGLDAALAAATLGRFSLSKPKAAKNWTCLSRCKGCGDGVRT